MKAFVIDVSKCNGCFSCQVACKDEFCGNNWMPYSMPQPDEGQFWFKLEEKIRGQVPQVKVAYVPRMCMHCDDAPCMKACPSQAIEKRPDGLVLINPAKCTGKQMCVPACPYDAIYFNKDLQLAQKCNGCAHLLDRGWPIQEPRCVNSCFPGMIKFGEEEDLKDLIAQAEPLPTNFGPTPQVRVYYLNLPKRFIAGTVYDPGTKEVVAGATVTLSGDGSATATTDEFGDFWFEGLKIGKFALKIDGAGKTKTIDNISTAKDVGLGDIALA